MYAVWATVRAGRTCVEVEDALNAEMARAASGDITEEEFEKARKQAKALFAYDSESVSSQGFWLGMAETLAGDYEWFDTFLDRLMAVRLEDVRRVAGEILQPTQRVVGWFEPIQATEEEA
jgi:zinc protease